MDRRDTSARLAGGGGVDDCFVTQPIGGLWAVVSSEIIIARCPSVPEAIRAAVQVASRTAGYPDGWSGRERR